MNALVLVLISVVGGPPSVPPPSPYLRPEFQRLMDAVTFHLSFDAGSMLPDMAEAPQFQPHVVGSHDKTPPAPRFAP
jgi:hypothetical protein